MSDSTLKLLPGCPKDGVHLLEPGEAPDGLSNGDWASIQTQIAAAKYRVYQHENDGFVSSNPAHGWQIHHAADGTTTLRPRDRQAQAYHLGLKLSAVGYTEPQTLDRPEQISSDDYTVTYQWNDTLREWWVNSATDLEQWFELEQRPPGVQNGQPLTLEMTLATDLAASQQGNALSFTNAAGTTISYNKLQVWDASGRELPARMQLAAKQLRLIIDDSDASYPLTIDPSFEQQAYVKASNTDSDDSFGFSVAISGNTLVVGADLEASNANGINGDQSDNSASGAGATYVFTRSGTAWSQQAYLKASNTGGGDRFGHSVAISGDTLVVGADKEDSNATGINGNQSNNSVFGAGAVYVFTRTGTVWSQQAYLKASNTDAGDGFGTSVAISGDTVVVGAKFERSNANGINGNQSNNSAFNAGAAYVFTRNGMTWSQQAYLKASNTDTSDDFGGSMAISGDTLVVGAPGEDSNATGANGDQSDNSADSAGAVYVFIRSSMTWSQQAYLKASNTDGLDLFGQSVAISGNTLVVGAELEDSNATGINGDDSNNSAFRAGAVYVFFDLLGFTINAGLNDAWFNPATAGQGFFIIVFPVIKMMFVAMFTFETELPDPSTPAMLGAAEHRWFTAFGPYEGDSAVLDIEITSDGVFDSPEPVVSQVPDGTLTVEFEDCSAGMITYNIPSIDRMGVIPIQRLADDNEALCEELNTQ